MNSVIKRSRAQKNIGVGRQGRGCMSKGSCKDDTFCGKIIDVGCFYMLWTVTAQPVCPQGIYRYQKQVKPIFPHALLC